MKKSATTTAAASAITTIKALAQQRLHSQALKASTSLPIPNLKLTDTLYSLFIKSGFALDPFLSATLISHSSLALSSASDFFSRALNFLNETLHPDVVVFNSIISGLARFGQFEPKLMVFNELRQMGLKPDPYSFSSLIKGCDEIVHNEMAHGVAIKLGLVKNVFLVSGLVENYSKTGYLTSAEKCFRENWSLDSVVWTSMINVYVSNDRFDEGKDVLREMRELGIHLNEFALTILVGGVGQVKEGQQIHGFSLKIGFLNGCSICLNNAIMSMYGRIGYKNDAIRVFEENPEPDVVSWAERIGVAYDGMDAWGVFQFCVSRNLEVNEYTIINLLSKFEGSRMLKLGKQVHLYSYKNGYLSSVPVSNALISMYGNVCDVDGAERVFGEMIALDSVSWNALITGYADNGLTSKVVSLFSQMRTLALEPNEYTLASLLDTVSGSNSLALAMQVHSFLIKWGKLSYSSMLSCLLIAYGNCGGIHYSKRLFDETDNGDLKHWHAMICALGHAGRHRDIFQLFQERWSSSSEVDILAVSIALKACGVLTELEHGRMTHSLALKSGIHVDYFVESAIIDVYCKCGSLIDAEMAFGSTSRDNIAAWNAMMMGYAQCGFYHEVFFLFRHMCESCLHPDEITYLAILSSCCHAGLVNEALYHLNSMLDLHKVTPQLEHYACVIDLLGRVGHLEEAMSIIDHMPIQPDAQIWQILLSACSIHNNIDVGKVVARKLQELQPENNSGFVLLSNLYASAGKYNAARDLRLEMKEKVVSKEPGYSWIQVA
ncbi:OLC1v1029824C1 [Oldenlandia corymbosa var. corymbosa]|uniref:OLC1v1029824C1 n=1 Tax=Oldenlandia corymbosa var. corymbosa TaxID=529605 RepID=A0AAV1CFF6_OLDCO|nr:OLC1v1029824C1 [Oldenlandia corymbosa var. corymbosa]